MEDRTETRGSIEWVCRPEQGSYWGEDKIRNMKGKTDMASCPAESKGCRRDSRLTLSWWRSWVSDGVKQEELVWEAIRHTVGSRLRLKSLCLSCGRYGVNNWPRAQRRGAYLFMECLLCVQPGIILMRLYKYLSYHMLVRGFLPFVYHFLLWAPPFKQYTELSRTVFSLVNHEHWSHWTLRYRHTLFIGLQFISLCRY